MYTLTADDVANQLGIAKQTLYAYVSRGKIRAQKTEGARTSRYHEGDVAEIARAKQIRSRPKETLGNALTWGAPLLETSLSTVRNGQLYFRGTPVDALVDRPFEETAALLWDVDEVSFRIQPASLRRSLPKKISQPFLHEASVQLARFDALDTGANDPHPTNLWRCGQNIGAILVAIAAPTSRDETEPVAQRLAETWRAKRHKQFLNAALVVMADHELNPSTFTARCVASAGATPYASILAGICAMKGARHGGAIARVHAMFDEAGKPNKLVQTIRARRVRGDSVPGFDHPLYPDGDPRASLLFERTKPKSSSWQNAVVEAHTELGLAPSIDIASAAVCMDLGLPLEAPLALFVIGRVAGWVAHVREQVDSAAMIRPRARYVGPALDL